ncbi:Aldehyde dehydrogenase (plasmid) [Salmonella enterica subsp. enterica serovar Enteritidis]|nr:Aldehyde dehydrogenase [Salmonella enterica subsp. enterica serovar Enteritidis]
MPAFEWVHVQLHQQKGMISLSPPTICNSALRAVSFPADAKKPAGLWLSYAHRSHFYEPAVVIPDRCRQAEQP